MVSEINAVNELDVSGEAALYEALRQMWHPVLYAGELEAGPKRVDLLDQQLVVVRLGGKLCVFPDLCAHRGTALSLGWVENDELRCAYHGWTYGQDGVCTSIPAAHGTNIPQRARLRRYLVREQLGLIWVCLDDHPWFDLPEYPQFDDSAFRILTIPAYDWKCSAARRIENFVDLAHIAWVHDGVIGSRDHPEVPEHEVRRVGGELQMAADMEEPPSIKTGQPLSVHVTWRLFMPFSILWNQELLDGHHFGGFITCTPTGRKLTRTFTHRHLNYDVADDELIGLESVITEADRVIAESQRPEELPVDLTAELHIRGADRISIEYRKWLVEIKDAFLAGRRE